MKTLTIDFETKDPYIGEGLGSGWCYPGDKFKVLGASVKYNDSETRYIVPKVSIEPRYKALRQYLSEAKYDEDTYIIMHNVTYDLGCLRKLGLTEEEVRPLNFIDTEVMGRLYDSSHMSYALDALAKKYLGHRKDNMALVEAIREHELVPYAKNHIALLEAYEKADEAGKEAIQEDLDKKDKTWQAKALKWAKSNMDILQDVAFDVMALYANKDVDLTYQLYKFYMDNCATKGWKKEDFLAMTVKYSNVAKITTSYRDRGVRVDLDRCREVAKELEPKITESFNILYKIAGEEFNSNSPDDKVRIFRSIVGRTGRSKFDSTGKKYKDSAYERMAAKIVSWEDADYAEVLKDLKDKGMPRVNKAYLSQESHPLAAAILEANSYKFTLNNFVQKILDMQTWCLDKTEEEVSKLKYGLVFPELNLMRASTGRFSCSSPNVQNQPSRHKYLAPLVRSIYVPFPGERIYSLDYCYSDDTEVLTEDGFKYFKDVTYDDKLAQYNALGNIVYDTPLDLIDLPYEGEMYRQQSRHVDLLVSPNHNLVLKDANGEIIKRKASEGLPKGHKTIHAGVCTKGTLDKDMRLQAAIDADGSIKRGLCTFYLKKERKVNRLINLLNEFKMDYTHKTDLPSKPDYHAIYFRWDIKNLDDDILNLTLDRRVELLEELQYWDGNSNCFFTAVEDKADRIQKLAIISGWRASISEGKGGYTDIQS
jgi:hypothetical protein